MAEQLATFEIVVGVALVLAGVGFAVLALGGALRPPDRRADAAVPSRHDQGLESGLAWRLREAPG